MQKRQMHVLHMQQYRMTKATATCLANAIEEEGEKKKEKKRNPFQGPRPALSLEQCLLNFNVSTPLCLISNALIIIPPA